MRSNEKYSCNNLLKYDIGLLEELDSLFGNSCKIINLLTRPSKRFYLRINTLKISKEDFLNKRETIKSKVKKNYLDIYETIKIRKGFPAITSVLQSGACTGCYRMLPPQQFNELISENVFMQCPICSRILYIENIPPKTAEDMSASLKKASKKASKYDYTDRDLMHIYSWLGIEYAEKGDYSNALFYESKSLKLAEQFGNVDAEKDDLDNIASIFQNEGNGSKALEYYKKALELENGKSETGTIYNNIASLYSDMHNYKKAIEYDKKAINVAEEHGNYLRSGEWMLNLGVAYLIIKDFKDAKFYLEKGLKRTKKVGNKYGEGAGYWYFGWYYKDIGNKALAKKYLMKALDIFRAIGDDGDASGVLKDLSSIK